MTCDKKFADELIGGKGYHPNCGDPAPDNPRASRIVEYTDIGGKVAYGVTFEGIDDVDKYAHETPYIRNPKIYWEYRAASISLNEGDKCPNDCGGTLELLPSKNCSCFIAPPCQSCTDRPLTCNACGHEVPYDN